jgi:hypothetical protein
VRKIVLACSLFLLAACSGANSGDPANPSGASERPKDAATIAASLVEGRIQVLVHVDRVRPHPVGPKLLKLGPLPDLLEGSSFDPLRDVSRAVVVANNARQERAVVFAEHTVDPAKIPTIVEELVQKSEPRGQVMGAAPDYRVKVSKKGREGVICFVGPRFVAVVPPDLAARCDAFDETGGLPGPRGEEAADIVVREPAESLRAEKAPRIPPTVTNLTAQVFLDKNGGATIDALGQSTEATAANDAAELTRNVDAATSLNLGIFKVRAFGPVVFAPEGDKVKSRLALSASEIDQLLSLANTFLD